MNFCMLESPIGKLRLMERDGQLAALDFIDDDKSSDIQNEIIAIKEEVTPFLAKCCSQLQEYFEGKRESFNIPLYLEGTEFQKLVWNTLLTVSYGETESYKQIAVKMNKPKAMRAVGNANHNNKIPIIIPCHRVIGTNGKMVGYGGGLWRKEWLLALEKTKK